MEKNAILSNLVYEEEAGTLRYKGVRYLLIRPETLGELLKAVEPVAGDQAGEALYRGGFEGGRLSTKTYREVHGFSDREIIDFMMRMGREIGWGRLSLEQYSSDGPVLEVRVRGSAFAEAYGPSSRPVCHLIRGVVAGMGSVLLGREVRALEPACESMGDPCCRFTLSGE
ncbi:MAG: hypothetical protein K9M82_00435 [Deltaproteobacteria bacterium]|nr:hypothetical protein [Deltaproteobacteria bacterium]